MTSIQEDTMMKMFTMLIERLQALESSVQQLREEQNKNTVTLEAQSTSLEGIQSTINTVEGEVDLLRDQVEGARDWVVQSVNNSLEGIENDLHQVRVCVMMARP